MDKGRQIADQITEELIDPFIESLRGEIRAVETTNPVRRQAWTLVLQNLSLSAHQLKVLLARESIPIAQLKVDAANKARGK